MTADSQAEREAALKRRRLAYENLGCELGWDETNGPQAGDPIYNAVMEYANARVALSEAAARAAGRGEAKQQRLYDVAALHSPEREAYERGRGAGYAAGRGEAAERIEALEGALREASDELAIEALGDHEVSVGTVMKIVAMLDALLSSEGAK